MELVGLPLLLFVWLVFGQPRAVTFARLIPVPPFQTNSRDDPRIAPLPRNSIVDLAVPVLAWFHIHVVRRGASSRRRGREPHCPLSTGSKTFCQRS